MANDSPTLLSVAVDRCPRILVIEDDADARENLTDLLELDGFEVDCAATAREALANPKLKQYAAIVLDRRLPDAVAEDLLPDLRSLAPDVGVIVVTAFAEVSGIIQAMRGGAADYIFKPVDAEFLRASVARLVERRSLQQLVRRSESARLALMESVPCIVLSLKADGRIAYFNEFAAELLGTLPSDAIGQPFGDMLKPELQEGGGRQRVRYDPLVHGRMHDVEAVIHCRDGSERWTIWNWSAVEDADGNVLLGVAQDITARKAAEERALQNERLAAIGQTMAGLVHESRNALQRSKACLEMLTHEVDDRPNALKLLSRVQRAQDDLHRLFEEVREYAAPLRLDIKPTDVPVIWRESWEQLAARRGGHNVALIERLDPKDAVIPVDRFALGQVFRNVFENAIDVSPADSEVSIEMAADSLSGTDAVRISIHDQGPGFSEEQKKRIFEPFFTTKTKGTGLGMAICQRIVEAHGGRIAVESNGAGAEIAIRLPRGKP